MDELTNNSFSHVDENGKINMVDVSGKASQLRKAIASGSIKLKQSTIRLIKDNSLKKGDVIACAKIAGIQAAKRTSELIPLCHPLFISKVNLHININENSIRVTSTVICTGQTGVEMEALTAVSVSLLTIYDMCKAVDKEMVLTEISLKEKTKHDIKDKT